MTVSSRIRRLAVKMADQHNGKKTGDYSGVGLFIPLPAKYAKYFPKKDRDKSPPHVTFLYVGKVQKEEEAEFLSVCREACKRYGPAKASLVDYAEFQNPKGETISHVEVGFNVDMSVLRRAIRRELMDAGFQVDDSFLGYKPHSTLAYLEEGETYDGKVPVGTFDVKGIEVWGLSTVQTLPLA